MVAWGQSSSGRLGVVVEAKNITLPAGSKAVLPCHSPRMVWTRDRLKDRQRVVHWDLVRSSPEYSVERVLDMSPGARQRVYNGLNKGRISIPDSAFNDGNFSLIINSEAIFSSSTMNIALFLNNFISLLLGCLFFSDVVTTDKGVYTCNLHHHYCQIHQSVQIQLNVTKSGEASSSCSLMIFHQSCTKLINMFFTKYVSARREKRYWDGEKTVFVVLLGSSVALPCVNRRPLWREGLQEDQQQVAHWDFQAPGVRPDRADRLVDLYASGERRDYGPLFAQSKMSVAEDAFTLGDFSLSISDLRPVDKGLYSCHLHHHYCGLQERRIFRLTVGPPLPPGPTTEPKTFQNDVPEPSKQLRIKNLKRNTLELCFSRCW